MKMHRLPVILTWVAVLLGWVCSDAFAKAKSPVFEPHCDIHVTNPGRRTPDDMFSSKVTPEWLNVPEAEILEWYAIGKKECEAHLKSAHGDMGYGHAQFFTDPNNIPHTTHCRGRNTLLDFSGMILWPFGPYKECPTYSKCWFGILSCGEPKNSQIEQLSIPQLKQALIYYKLSFDIPKFTAWSVRALSLLVRVIGAEIVVPETRYMTVDQDDVIIGQYVLTRVHDDTKLEIRMFEFYTSRLFEWSKSQIEEYGMHNWASLYLGGSEGRCRPWTKCESPNNMPVCDEKSFVFNTPAAVTVTDGLPRCPKARETVLPLCATRDSSQPGRWIASDLPTFTPHCDAANKNTIFHKDVKAVSKDAHPGDTVKQEGFNLSAHHYTGAAWYEASGDPCLVNAKEPEDAGRSHWFYAPYTCKYHFYNSVELHKCLVDKKLTHIHLAGDSMSRDLFGYVSVYLGVPLVDEAELKRRTNQLKESNVQFHTGNVMLSEGYSWDFDVNIMKLTERAPLPNIYITNYGLAHRNWNYPAFQALWERTEYAYWTTRSKSIPSPEFMFFQNAKELSGRRNIGWIGNVFRQDSTYLKRNYTSLGFSELDEFLFSTGRYDFHIPQSDGWHFGGSKRQMEVVALFNMVCNDWFNALSVV